MEQPSISPAYLHKTLKSMAWNLACALTDADANRHHLTPIYMPDFSLFAPVWFGEAAQGAKDFTPAVGDVTTWVLQNADAKAPFMLAIGAPMYYEFIDQLHHRAQDVSRLPQAISELGKVDIDRLFEKEASLKSQEFLNRIKTITNSGVEERVMRPAMRLKALIEEGKLLGIGDFITAKPTIPLYAIKNRFNDLVMEMKQYRLEHDLVHHRDREDSMFHYKMDAANICFALYYQHEVHSQNFYMTKEWPQIRKCRKGDTTFARHYATSLFLTNATILQKSGYVKDLVGWLGYSLEHCNIFLKSLNGLQDKENWEGIPGDLVERLKFFNDATITRLYDTRRHDFSEKRQEDIEELRQLLSDRRKFEASIEKAHESVKTAARIVPIDSQKLGIDQMDQFEVRNDPVFQKMCRTLNIQL